MSLAELTDLRTDVSIQTKHARKWVVSSSWVVMSLSMLAGVALTPTVLHAQSTSNDTLIVPGKSIGAIALGMSPADVFRILGDPEHSGKDGDFPNGTLYWYNMRGIRVTIDRSVVVQIGVSGKQYATREGVGVGASELRVSALLGKPKRTAKYKRECEGRISGYHYRGLWMHFDCDGRVDNIAVWSGT